MSAVSLCSRRVDATLVYDLEKIDHGAHCQLYMKEKIQIMPEIPLIE